MSTRKRRNETSQPPPWEVLVLVATHLDPKSLSISSCVSKSWYTSMSSDPLWEPIVSTQFPSLSSLHRSPSSPVPFRRLYTLGRASARLRLRKPTKPVLRLANLVFSISLHDGNSHVFTVEKPGSELRSDQNGVFRFDFDVLGGSGTNSVAVGVGGLRVTWNVVLEGYKGVFTMMDRCCKGKGVFVGWFTEELPPPPGCYGGGCCSGGGYGGTGSGLVADLRLGLLRGGGGKEVVVEKVGVGMMNVVCWRYSSVEDALGYLQHFLMPSAE